MRPVLLLALLATVVEALRLAALARFPVQPDFLLGLVVLASLSLRPPRGAVVGAVLGFLRDILQGTPAGFSAFPMAAIGWGVGTLGRSVYREAWITQAVMLFGAGLGLVAFEYLFARRGELTGFLVYFFRSGLPSALVTALVVPLVYRGGMDLYRDRHTWRRTALRRLRSYERKILVKR